MEAGSARNLWSEKPLAPPAEDVITGLEFLVDVDQQAERKKDGGDTSKVSSKSKLSYVNILGCGTNKELITVIILSLIHI